MGLFHTTFVDAQMPIIIVEVAGHKVINTLIDGVLGIKIITDTFLIWLGLQGM